MQANDIQSFDSEEYCGEYTRLNWLKIGEELVDTLTAESTLGTWKLEVFREVVGEFETRYSNCEYRDEILSQTYKDKTKFQKAIYIKIF
jgi:hypothetical protein